MLFHVLTQGRTSTTFSALSYLPVCFRACLIVEYFESFGQVYLCCCSDCDLPTKFTRSVHLSHTHLHWVCAFRAQDPVRLTSLKLFRSTWKSTTSKSISRKVNLNDNINLCGVPTLQFNFQVYLKNFPCRAKVNTKQ